MNRLKSETKNEVLLSMKCLKCLKQIDNDSVYCKNCGSKVDDIEIITHDNERLKNIFNGIYQTLYERSIFTKEEFDKKFDKYKRFNNRTLDNNDYYSIVVYVVFYSGFRAATVNKFRNSIDKYFDDYTKVAEYSDTDIDIMMKDSRMIKNKAKIKACIHNAKVLSSLINKHGSFKDYIESFFPENNETGLKNLRKDIIKQFDYIAEITSYHILTDIGLNVLKPDRVIMRIFFRLGLVESISDYWQAVIVGRKFSKVLDMPIRYIDIIFVMYGQLNRQEYECICAEKNPKCDKCRVTSFCQYYSLLNDENEQ